ncbi:hypothetical protein [Mesorhizobium abyssinicae]
MKFEIDDHHVLEAFREWHDLQAGWRTLGLRNSRDGCEYQC